MKRSSVVMYLLLTLCVVGAHAQINVPVTLRPGVTADLAVQVIENPKATPASISMVIVPGLAQTGATFVPLAQALFRADIGNKVGRVLVMDLPGHGASSLPSGMLFGDLALEDYTTSLIEVLAALQSQGIHPDVILGHSMGGEIVQMAQDRMLSAGTSLRDAFGVRGVVLLAPVIPEPLPWSFADSGAAAAILGSFIRFDPVYGPIGDVPPPFWVALFYTGRSGVLPAGAPSPADVVARGWSSFEAFVAGIEVVRAAAPPFVHARAFAAETRTTAAVVAMEQDAFFTSGEERVLYDYLTGDAQERLFFVVTGGDAVHNMHTFAPDAQLYAIKKLLNATDRN